MYSETFLRNTSSFFIFFKKAPPPQYTHAAATVRALRAFENAFGLAVGCPQSVESAVLRAFEDSSRTTEACFWHRISLPYRRTGFLVRRASENASRTGGGLFEHGTHIRYRRGPSPVPSAVEGAGEGSAGDKFRVSGTKEMVEGAGANKESGGRFAPLKMRPVGRCCFWHGRL